MGRSLGKDTYGDFSAVFALSFFIFSISSRTIKLIAARYISRFKSIGDNLSIEKLYRKMILYLTAFAFTGFIVMCVMSRVIGEFLHMSPVFVIVPVGAVLLISFVLPVNLGFLQGSQRFWSLAASNVSQAVVKLGVGVALVLIGMGIYGAVSGIVMGQLTALVISFILIHCYQYRKKKADQIKNQVRNEKLDFKNISSFSLPVFLSVICIMTPTNIDVLLVKNLFSQDTGLYAAASIFGKIIFFLPMAVATVMFPKVVQGLNTYDNQKKLLLKSLGFTILLAGLAVSVLAFFPATVLRLVYGREFLGAEKYLPVYALTIFFFSITTLLIYYNLAKKKLLVIHTFLILTITELVILYTVSETLWIFLLIFLASNIAISAIILLLTLFLDKKTLENSLDSTEI